MRRIGSVVLALVLAWSLAATAWAAEDLTPPLWQQYGFSSREECVRDWFGGDEAGYQARVDALLERERWEKTTMAAEIAAFDADEYWDSDQCSFSWYYDSKEEYMEEWLLETEEAFRQAMLEDWLDEEWDAYRQSTLIARTRAELGAVPGQIGVMLDGTYIAFGAAVPEMRDGRTMVPMRPLIEAMGGKVTAQDGTFLCTFPGGLPYSHVETASFQIGPDSYFKNGHTYMPLREVAEALGCDVLWDSTFQTAVLLQRARVIYELDQNFTVLNRMAEALRRDAEKNYKSVVKMDARVTLLDSINGDKTHRMNAEMELLQSGAALDLTMTMDLSALLEVEDMTDGLSAVETAALRAVLRNLKIQMIYDGEDGMAYLKIPALSLLSEGALPAGSWIAMPAATMEELTENGGATVGAALYQSMLNQAEWTGSYPASHYYEGMTTPATLYRDVHAAADQAAGYLGDGCFKDSGGYSVLHYDEEAYNAALEKAYGQGASEYLSDLEQLEVDLKVARDGAATFRVLVQNKDEGYLYAPVVLVDASGTVSAAKMDMKLLMKVKNQMELHVTYTAVTTVTNQTPRTAPGPGETVIDPYEDLYGGMVGEAAPEPLPESAA